MLLSQEPRGHSSTTCFKVMTLSSHPLHPTARDGIQDQCPCEAAARNRTTARLFYGQQYRRLKESHSRRSGLTVPGSCWSGWEAPDMDKISLFWVKLRPPNIRTTWRKQNVSHVKSLNGLMSFKICCCYWCSEDGILSVCETPQWSYRLHNYNVTRAYNHKVAGRK